MKKKLINLNTKLTEISVIFVFHRGRRGHRRIPISGHSVFQRREGRRRRVLTAGRLRPLNFAHFPGSSVLGEAFVVDAGVGVAGA